MNLVISNRRIKNGQYFSTPKELEDYLGYDGVQFDTLIFAFWSWKVPDLMLKQYKCYGMHTGFLLDGKGKGGSPIDNLHKLGVKWAALNVFEMNNVFDAGKVRLAIPMPIEGREKTDIIETIDYFIPAIVSYLEQDISNVPETFQRIASKPPK